MIWLTARFSVIEIISADQKSMEFRDVDLEPISKIRLGFRARR